MSDLFELAARRKFRFNTVQGPLDVESLWDLPLKTTVGSKASLDSIAIGLDKQLKESGTTVSFVDNTTKENDELKAKFDIVLRVIEVKKAENEAAANQQARRAEKQRILEVLAKKKDDKLENMTEDELKKLLENL